MRKLKVAQVVTRFDWGGSPDIVRVMCEYLDKETYDVKLVIGDTKHPTAKTKKFFSNWNNDITVIPQLKRRISPADDLSALIKLYLLFRKERFDIVHTHTAKAGFLGRLAARLAGVPVIIHTPHGHNLYGYFGRVISNLILILERLGALFTDKIIALTDLERQDYIKRDVADLNKIEVIYSSLEPGQKYGSGINRDRVRQSLGISPDEKVVGMVGRLEPVKGAAYFIKSASGVTRRFPRIKFVLVGEGSLRNDLEKLADKIGLKDKFIFTGWREDAPELLSIFDILVLPSLNEAVGLVLIEAQGMGVPVIASDVGGIPETIRDNQTGLLVPSGDAAKLSEAISRLLTDDDARKKMALAGKEWIKDRFKAEDMVDKTSGLYKKMFAEKGKL